MMTLGQKIQISRKKMGMSQEDLGNVLNVSRQAVQKWESDVSIPELNKLVEISRMFDVSMDWLTKDVEENKLNTYHESVIENKNTSLSEPGKKTDGYIKAIKVFVWIGMILSPLALAGSFFKLLDEEAFWFLFDFLITIPLGIWSLYVLKRGASKEKYIILGILNVIFVSQIAGILMFAIPKELTLPKKEKVFEQKAPEVIPSVKPDPVIKEEIRKADEAKIELKPKKPKEPIEVARVISITLKVFAILILIVFSVIIFAKPLAQIHYEGYWGENDVYYYGNETFFESDGSMNVAYVGLLFVLIAGLLNSIFCFMKYKKKNTHALIITPILVVLMIVGSAFIRKIPDSNIHLPEFPHVYGTFELTLGVILGIISSIFFLTAAIVDVYDEKHKKEGKQS